MGEIADALRRARESRALDDEAKAPDSRSEVAEALRQVQPSRSLHPSDPPNGSSENVLQARREVQDPSHLATARAQSSASPRAPQTVESLEPTTRAIVREGSAGIEHCRRLAVRLREEIERFGAKTVAIVSAVRGEGKTTTVCDLALAMAAMSPDGDVAVVDLDLRRPSLARTLGVEPKVGVEEILRGNAPPAEARIAVQHPRFDLYAAAAAQESAAELFVSNRFEEVIAELARQYAVVLIDTPPVLVVPDVSIMMRHVAGCVPIARSGVTRTREFKQLIAALPHDKVIGQLFNDAHLTSYGAYTYSDATQPAPTDAGKARRGGARRLRGRALRRRAP